MSDQNKPDLPCGCPGSAMQQFDDQAQTDNPTGPVPSRLAQWPVQLTLVPPNAPYFQDADLVVVADCVPFAYGNFHGDFLKGRPIVVGCPKLDNLPAYVEKLTEIFKINKLKSVEVMLMEVPCCGGLAQATKMAVVNANADIPVKITTIGVRGENMGTQQI